MALSQEQMQNALTIYQVGRSRGLGLRDITIALITAMTESNLINVHYGDRDSLGLFQQRASWGSAENRMNPGWSANKFYDALMGLGKSRFSMSPGQAAQAVQRSAFPDRYQTHLGQINAILPTLGAKIGENPQSMDGGPFGAINPQTGLPPANQPMFTSPDLTGGETNVGIPDAATMLGAWGMNSPQPLDPLTTGMSTMIGPHTNDSFLKPIMSASGDIGKGIDGWRAAVIQAARSALGTPYTWGGTSLQNGVDCSGLVQSAFAKAGIDLPRISYQQANQGQRVGLKGLNPGDLVAWDNSSRNNGADHIAIYLGHGMIIEAPRPGLSVRIRHLSNGLEGGWGVHLGF